MKINKRFVLTAVVIIIAFILVVISVSTFWNKSQNTNILTPTEAQALVIQTWGDCSPDMCSRVVVSVEQKNNQWYVTALYEGLRDDSSSAQKRTAEASYSNAQWSLGTPTITQSCQPNRGHQDFSSVPCI